MVASGISMIVELLGTTDTDSSNSWISVLVPLLGTTDTDSSNSWISVLVPLLGTTDTDSCWCHCLELQIQYQKILDC